MHKKRLKLGEIPISFLNPTYNCDIYMNCVSDDKNIFLLMHKDNDFRANLKKSILPINQALKKYYPNSKYVGDMLLVMSDTDDRIIQGHWDHSILLNYELLTKEDNMGKDGWKGIFMPIQEKTDEPIQDMEDMEDMDMDEDYYEDD